LLNVCTVVNRRASSIQSIRITFAFLPNLCIAFDRQAPRARFDRLRTYLLKIGFRATGSDASLFVFTNGGDTAYLVVYVDDIILTASTDGLLHRIVQQSRDEFAIKDMGALRLGDYSVTLQCRIQDDQPAILQCW
jgi:hypothetical protein